jgi:hypothetical protein
MINCETGIRILYCTLLISFEIIDIIACLFDYLGICIELFNTFYKFNSFHKMNGSLLIKSVHVDKANCLIGKKQMFQIR